MIDEAALRHACSTTLPAGGSRALVDAVARAVPGCAFHLAMTRDGWYRTGGVVDAHGARVAETLRTWAEAECGGDVTGLAARYLDAGYFATRLEGRTHFLVAPTGDGPLDFVQVEVEEVREMVDRPLFDPGALPDDIEDLVDPLDAVRAEPPVPVGPPRYQLRRATAFHACGDDPASPFCGDKFFRRFVGEWQASSAGEAVRFCDQWVLTLVPYTDRFGEHRFDVKPRPVVPDSLAPVDPAAIERGSELGRLIHRFDREAGYPMAWYFLMLASKRVPHQMAEAVHDDLMGAYAYLPMRDLKVLKAWIREPYRL